MTWPAFKNLKRNRLILYLIGGGVSFTVEYTIFLLAYYYFGFVAFNANAISFCAGLATSFLINKLLVFGGGNEGKYLNGGTQIASYATLALANLFITGALIEICVRYGLPGFGAKALAICLTAVWNFIIFKRFIFR